jgi:hypothetical protein
LLDELSGATDRFLGRDIELDENSADRLGGGATTIRVTRA